MADRLRELIIDGRLPPGTRLRPNELAFKLDVSVMPVREALRLLEAEDLVSFAPHKGATVADLAADEVEEIYLMRAALEQLAATLVVSRVSDAEVARLRVIFDKMSAARDRGDLRAFLGFDREFHSYMHQCSGRPYLAKTIMDLWDRLRRLQLLTPDAEAPMMTATLGSHEAILIALESRDPERVAYAAKEHTETAARRVLAALAASSREQEHKPAKP